jgi:hypothetical protein
MEPANQKRLETAIGTIRKLMNGPDRLEATAAICHELDRFRAIAELNERQGSGPVAKQRYFEFGPPICCPQCGRPSERLTCDRNNIDRQLCYRCYLFETGIEVEPFYSETYVRYMFWLTYVIEDYVKKVWIDLHRYDKSGWPALPKKLLTASIIRNPYLTQEIVAQHCQYSQVPWESFERNGKPVHHQRVEPMPRDSQGYKEVESLIRAEWGKYAPWLRRPKLVDA